MKKEIILRTSKGEVFVEMEDRTMKSYIDLDDNDLKTLVEGGSDGGSGSGGGDVTADDFTLHLKSGFLDGFDPDNAGMEELTEAELLSFVGITPAQHADAANGKYLRVECNGSIFTINAIDSQEGNLSWQASTPYYGAAINSIMVYKTDGTYWVEVEFPSAD